jgi:hypothetical protein
VLPHTPIVTLGANHDNCSMIRSTYRAISETVLSASPFHYPLLSLEFWATYYTVQRYTILRLICGMADPISTASGVLALAVFAFQSSRVLYQTVTSFQSNQRTIRQLKEELEALNGALVALQETATNADIDLAMLRLPLLRCGKACEDFEALIGKCTAHSRGPKTSFRDWAKLRYMGDDIDGFKNMLAGYKSTIMIALGDANM